MNVVERILDRTRRKVNNRALDTETAEFIKDFVRAESAPRLLDSAQRRLGELQKYVDHGSPEYRAERAVHVSAEVREIMRPHALAVASALAGELESELSVGIKDAARAKRLFGAVQQILGELDGNEPVEPSTYLNGALGWF